MILDWVCRACATQNYVELKPGIQVGLTCIKCGAPGKATNRTTVREVIENYDGVASTNTTAFSPALMSTSTYVPTIKVNQFTGEILGRSIGRLEDL